MQTLREGPRRPSTQIGKMTPFVTASLNYRSMQGHQSSKIVEALGEPPAECYGSCMSLIKSKKRVVDHGEVFTPSWLVENMLDLVKGEAERIDSRFLETACGSGNFLVLVLQRKLAAVESRYSKSPFERGQYAMLALMCIYGIELLHDNIEECKDNILKTFSEFLNLDKSSDMFRAGYHVLGQNLLHGNALTMRSHNDDPICFAEWGYLGRGRFQRRDFRLDVLTSSSAFSAEGSLFAQLGKHELFTPIKTYPAMTIQELANE